MSTICSPHAVRRNTSFVPYVIALAFVVATAACGSSTPEQKAEAPAGAAAPASTTLSVEWTDVDLEKDSERNAYASKPDSLLSRNAEGLLVFTPQSDRDHIATRPAPLQTYDGERTLELVVDAKVPGGETCVANLQDQAYNLIGSVPCRTAGEQRGTVAVPRSVSTVRIFFQSATREPLRLPARVQLIEHR